MSTEPTSNYVSANGVKLHYLQWGDDGPSIVIEHANSHCGGLWGPVVSRLDGRFCIRAFDL